MKDMLLSSMIWLSSMPVLDFAIVSPEKPALLAGATLDQATAKGLLVQFAR